MEVTNLYNLPNIQGKTTDEKVNEVIQYLYQLVNELNNNSNNPQMILSEIQRISSIDENSLVGNPHSKQILEQKNQVNSLLEKLGVKNNG